MISVNLDQFNEVTGRTRTWFQSQSRARQVMLVAAAVAATVLGLLALIFHKKLLALMVDWSDRYARLHGGAFILFVLVFTVGFPPLIGFSALSMFAGMVYGFPNGWPLLALALISGLMAAFVVFRYLLQTRAQALMDTSPHFAALSAVMREDKRLVVLVLVRLCPLPYSLTNGALAAIPDVSVWRYLAVNVLTSPKFLIHIFVGAKLKDLGEAKSTGSRVVDIVSILMTALAASGATYLIYHRMQQKMLEVSEYGMVDPELQTLGGESLGDSYDDDPSSFEVFSDGEETGITTTNTTAPQPPPTYDEEVQVDDLGLGKP